MRRRPAGPLGHIANAGARLAIRGVTAHESELYRGVKVFIACFLPDSMG